MLLVRNNLFLAIAACACGSGCSVPWSVPFSRQSDLPATKIVETQGEAVPADNFERPGATAASLTTGEESQPDLSGVLDKLQQIREIDPTAEQQLLAELRQTPPESWPLVAEQFRASLAYREQLLTQRHTARESGTVANQADNAEAQSVRPGLSLSSQRPAPINMPSDRGNVDSDGISNQVQALTTPIFEIDQANSAQFVAQAPTYPIHSLAAADVPNRVAASVVQARFDTADQQNDARVATVRAAESLRPAPADIENGWRGLTEMAAEELSRGVVMSPTTTAEVHQHASLRILYLLTGETEKALEPIPHISPVEQDYWSKQLFALATYLDHHNQPDDKRRAAASVIHLDQAVSSLRELGSLSVRNLSFCKNVHGYGSIDPYDKAVFSPGQQVSMYVEVENYHSTPTEKGYRTSLGSTYELLAENGARVGGGELPDVEDYCRSCRRDFHIQYGLTLPETIAPGQYRLQLVIKDRQSDKIGHAAAAFEIGGTAR